MKNNKKDTRSCCSTSSHLSSRSLRVSMFISAKDDITGLTPVKRIIYSNNIQISAIADKTARAALPQTCCKQRWMFSVINLQPNYVDNGCDSRRFQVMASYLPKVANFSLPHLHLAPPSSVGGDPFEFCRDLWLQKTRVPWLSCGIVCVIHVVSGQFADMPTPGLPTCGLDKLQMPTATLRV